MKIAIVQSGAIHNNLEKSLEKADAILAQAADQNCDLVVFGETWLCGYPAWIDYSPEAALWNHDPVKKVWADMYKNAIDIKNESYQQLKHIIKKHNVLTVMGMNEVITEGKGNGTIYNTVMIIDKDGTLLNHHRKLMPTYGEKLVYGLGDGAGLRSVKTAHGQIGALICWEHWMPLTRQAMHDEGEDIHIALWPTVKEMNIIACRQYAFEGRCHVIAVGQMMALQDTPQGLSIPDHMKITEYAMEGGSCIISPDGQFVLEPQYNVDDTIYIELSNVDSNIPERMNLSTSGHYQRPDVFKLKVNKKRVR